MNIDELIKDCVLANHLDTAPIIARSLSIMTYYDYYLETNQPVVEAYHSNLHSVVTMLNCYEGVMNSIQSNDIDSVVAITLAGLFHDSDHLQGKQKDDRENITLAVQSLTMCHELITEDLRVSDKVFALAVDLIKSTEYPYTRKDPKSELHAIIRDADLMGVYLKSKEQKKQLVCGLFNELQRNRTLLKKYSLSDTEYYSGQQSFLLGIKWFSRYGKIKAVKYNFRTLIKEWVDSIL